MTTIVTPICLGCTHFHRDETGLTCDAFPEGIPAMILESKRDHRQPADGDHDIRFEPQTPEDAAYADEVFR